jgi:hypothetical protein
MKVALHFEGYVELPEHRGKGGFDYAAVHRELGIRSIGDTVPTRRPTSTSRTSVGDAGARHDSSKHPG